MAMNQFIRVTMLVSIFGVCSFWLVGLLVAQPEKGADRFGDLVRLADIEPAIRVVEKNGKLEIGYSTKISSASRFKSAIRNMKRNVASSSSNSGRGWNETYRLSSFEFLIGLGQIRRSIFPVLPKANGGLVICIKQKVKPFNEYKVAAGPNNDFLSVQLQRSQAGYYFEFNIRPEGTISCVVLDGSAARSVSAASYDEFARDHRQLLNEEIIPVLNICSVRLPHHRYSSFVWNQVVATIVPGDSQRHRQFEKIIEQLSSADFSEREMASKKLSEKFDQWNDLILRKMQTDETTVETRSRLQKLVDQLATASQKESSLLTRIEKLAKDPEYLFWIARQIRDDRKRGDDLKHLFSKMAALTKNDWGDDWDRWGELFGETVARKAQKDTSRFVSSVALPSKPGPMDEFKKDVGLLVPLKIQEGLLKVDEDRWEAHFSGKTPLELIEEIRQVMAESRLPANWLQPDRTYLPETIQYPHILFESLTARIADDARPQDGYQRVSRGSLNRACDKSSLSVVLKMHPTLPEKQRNLVVVNGRQLNRLVQLPDGEIQKRQFYSVEFFEKSGAARTLQFSDYPNGELSLTINLERDGCLIRYMQKLNSSGRIECTLQDLRGNDVFVTSGDSITSLFEKHPRYFQEQWAKILALVGVESPK